MGRYFTVPTILRSTLIGGKGVKVLVGEGVLEGVAVLVEVLVLVGDQFGTLKIV